MIDTHVHATTVVTNHLYLIFFRYFLPGNDHGSYENPFNAWSLLMSSRNLQMAL